MDRPLFFFFFWGFLTGFTRVLLLFLSSTLTSCLPPTTPHPPHFDSMSFPPPSKLFSFFFFFFFTWCFPAWVEFNLFFCSFLSPLFHLPLCNCCRLRYLYIIDPLFLCVSLRVCVLVWSFCAFSFFLLLLMSPVTEVFHDDLRCFALKVGQPFRCLCCCPR